MEGFTYHDIFQTKGIEYIIIIIFLLLLIPFWMIINKRAVIVHHLRKALGVLNRDILKVPGGIFYSRNHTWAHLEKSGTAKIGLDDLLLHITGNVQLNYKKQPGEIIKKGEIIAEIMQGGKALSILSPISGQVVHTNAMIEDDPSIMNQDPYDNGWIYSIKPSDWINETRSYYFAEEASKWTTQELERFKDFIAASLSKQAPEPQMVILQEGGELSDHALSGMPDDIWKAFQDEFLEQAS
jgi:glycine cleavage system H protein